MDQGGYNQGGYDQGNQGQWNQPPRQWNQQQRQQWNQHMNSVPPGQFNQAVTQQVQQMDPQEYQNHMQTQPVQNLPQNQMVGLAQSLLSSLFNQGASQQQIQQQTGIPNLDPSRLTPQQISQLLQYAQQNHPQAMGQVATQYKNQPDVLHTILGNKALLGAAAALGMGLLSGQIQRK